MWPYWLMFCLPAWAVLAPRRFSVREINFIWLVAAVFYSVVMGLRFQVGGDWYNYLRLFNEATIFTLSETLGRGDPGYYGLNWLVANAGGSIFIVNLICATLMMWGTIVFCRAQPNPRLALLAAVPYMLIVVGMGYTRQAVALGFALLGMAALGNGRVRSFVFWVAIGATFHKSAVLLLPIAALASSRNRALTGFLVALTTGLLYYLLLADSSEALWENYVEAQYRSQGGLIRVLMNVVPALIFISWRKRLAPEVQERRLWLWISGISLVLLSLVPFASTAVDRVALYFIPLQLFVFSRVPRLATTVKSRTAVVLAVVVYYAAVQLIWLNFANFSPYWVPYQFMPLN